MSRPLRIPYIVYWLLVKDFFYNIDVCDTSNNEPGHCLNNSECSKIGTNIGPCDSETSDSVCCKITFNYFNETYLLKQIFVRKSQTDVVREMVIFSSGGPCGQSFLEYGNASISLKKKEKVYFIPEVHVFQTPDRIIWAIWASYSRESKDLKSQSFGTNHLYVIELNKLVADERDNKSHTVSECASESDEEKFYTLLNPEKRFPIRKFFTQRMQKLNTMNLTIDGSSFIEEIEPEKRSRRSVHVSMDKPEYSSCKKQMGDVLNVKGLEENDNFQSELEISHEFFKQMDNSEGYLKNRSENTDSDENIDSVINYVLKSKVVSEDLTERDNLSEELSTYKKNRGKIALDEPVFIEKLSDSIVISKHSEERTVDFQKIKLIDEIPMTGDTSYINPKSVSDKMRSQESEAIHDFRKPAKVEITQDLLNPMQLETTHDMRKPVQVDETHDMRKPVKSEATHGMQKAVKKESRHDMRIAVQSNVDHNMQKPVETGRESIHRESSHDMRKPVTLDESHDLRWPVLEGESDLRNFYKENDAFVNVNFKSKISDSIKTQRKLDNGKYKIDENVNLILQNSSLNCHKYISLFSKNSRTKNHSEENKKEKKLNDLWNEASKVCGKYSGLNSDTIDSKTKENWPWMVSLHENISGRFKYKCSASLLNSFWVITAAHCVDMKPKEIIVLVLGNQNRKMGKENVTERAIDEIVIHPRFNRGLFENDLALLRMKTPVTFQSAISPICLPWTIKELTHGIPVFLGLKLEDERTTDDLKDLAVPIMTNYECEILFSTDENKERIKDTFLCVGKDDRNCDSESGSSLVALDSGGRWSLIGLVSWGGMCTNLKQPGVYIRISSYAQWIKDVIDCYEILM